MIQNKISNNKDFFSNTMTDLQEAPSSVYINVYIRIYIQSLHHLLSTIGKRQLKTKNKVFVYQLVSKYPRKRGCNLSFKSFDDADV